MTGARQYADWLTLGDVSCLEEIEAGSGAMLHGLATLHCFAMNRESCIISLPHVHTLVAS
jgi:hypothetical protein